MSCFIKELNKSDCQKWNDFILNNPQASIFHTLAWKQVIEDTFKYLPLYFVLKNDSQEVVGIAPAFVIKTLYKKVLVSLPFFEYGGIIIKNGYEEGYNLILDSYLDIQKKERLNYIELKLPLWGPNYQDKYFLANGFIGQKQAVDYFIRFENIKDFEKDIWYQLFTVKSRVRNSVRKAMHSGIEIKEEDDIDKYYSLYLKTIERLGSLPLPKLLFINIKKYLGTYAKFTFAYMNNKPIAALLSFLYNNKDLMVGLVSDYNYQNFRSNDLLYYQEIKYAFDHGLSEIDFGRTRPNSTYEIYKKKWGAKSRDLYSYIYPAKVANKISPYSLYLTFSKFTKKNPLWKIITRTKISELIIKQFP